MRAGAAGPQILNAPPAPVEASARRERIAQLHLAPGRRGRLRVRVPMRDSRARRSRMKEVRVADDEDYVYDEVSGEWVPASQLAAAAAQANAVKDSAGNILADGDSVTLIKDLKVKGANQTLKQGTVIRSIRLTDDPEEIDCRHDTIKGLVLRTEFVKKR
jgi:protein PhnA